MKLDQVKVAIIAIIIIEIGMGVLGYFSGNGLDSGTIGMGITGIAGLAGYDFNKKE